MQYRFFFGDEEITEITPEFKREMTDRFAKSFGLVRAKDNDESRRDTESAKKTLLQAN